MMQMHYFHEISRQVASIHRASEKAHSRKLRNCRRRWSSSGANALAADKNGCIRDQCTGYWESATREQIPAYKPAAKLRTPSIGA